MLGYVMSEICQSSLLNKLSNCCVHLATSLLKGSTQLYIVYAKALELFEMTDTLQMLN
jgi:hypothetical protein